MNDFRLNRLGQVMSPEAGNPYEVEGVTNPAAARGPDGHLYLFPRLVGKGNYSRIGLARVRFDDAGDPVGVERLGIALEPEADYERRPDGGGGCEDPRVTYFEPRRQYVMTFTAHSPDGPRIAMAVSDDLLQWRRLGLTHFEPADGLRFDGVDDKDASVFPVPVPDPAGEMKLAMLHRPLFAGTRPDDNRCEQCDENRESIWISYAPLDTVNGISKCSCHSVSHRRLAAPAAPWERLKIGGGTPPVMTRHGWLILYHGVRELAPATATRKRQVEYSAGAIVLDAADPSMIRYRSPLPVLKPETPGERSGTVANVVFPTGIDRRDDLGTPDRFDVYYGMADDKIGVARLDVPPQLPPP